MKNGTFVAPFRSGENSSLADVEEFFVTFNADDWEEKVDMHPIDGRVLHTVDPETGNIRTYWREHYDESHTRGGE